MSAYMIFSYTITDPDAYQAYPVAAMPTMGAHGVEVLVADYASEAEEGSPGEVTVVLRFDSKEAARGWYQSDGYQAAKPLRTAATEGNVIICDGFVMPA
jgi:uncharacterized protein (DUF1330 family)